MITFVLTSCGRQDLLQETLDSFFKHCDRLDLFKEFIIIEDSTEKGVNDFVIERYPGYKFKLIYNDERLGMMHSIEKAYEYVDTEYIFHCEDDWRFLKGDFLFSSLSILASDRKCLQVWLRHYTDTNGHPTSSLVTHAGKVGGGFTRYRFVRKDFGGVWSGFSTNPGLRRKADMIKFSGLTGFSFPGADGLEAKASVYYKNAGYHTVLLDSNNDKGFVEHIGWERSVIQQKDYDLKNQEELLP